MKAPALLPLSAADVQAFRKLTTVLNPGIGIIDLRTGAMHLKVASRLAEGDHLSLAEEIFGVRMREHLKYLRGFVAGIEKGRVWIAGNSGLNPNNHMEVSLFKKLVLDLKAQIEANT